MSEHALVQQQEANTPEILASESFSLGQHSEQTTISGLLFSSGFGILAELRFDFSRITVFAGLVRQTQTLLLTKAKLQCSPKAGAYESGSCPNCPEAAFSEVSGPHEPAVEKTPSTESGESTIEILCVETETTPGPAVPGTESAVPAESSAQTLIVEDSVEKVKEGQMRKSVFLAQLRTEINHASEAAMVSTGQTTVDCPYLEYWFGYYSSQDSAHIERAIHRYVPAHNNPSGNSLEQLFPITRNVSSA